MDRAGLRAWVQLYERAWRTAGTELLAELFAPEATYRTAPFEEPFCGLPAIAAMWEAGQGDEVFTLRSEVVAVEGDTGVARVEVRYGDPVRQQYRDLWVARFDSAGRCIAFEEWPFWPKGTRGRLARGSISVGARAGDWWRRPSGGDVEGFFELRSCGSGRPRPRVWRPTWLGPPEDSFGVLVPLHLVLVRTADLAGWRSRQMVDRYAKSTAERRAREAHRRMSLGDRI